MLILNSRKAIYVHLQKCGGTSVELSLADRCKWNDVLIGSSLLGEIIQWEYFGKFGLHKHSAAKEIQAVIGRDLWASYFSFCTVRNPFERTASLYCYAASLVAKYSSQFNFPLNEPPSAHVAWARDENYPCAEPWSFPAVKAYLLSRDTENPFSAFLRDGNLKDDAAFSPQWWGVEDTDGESLGVTLIVKLEELELKWPLICEKLGFHDLPLMIANVTAQEFRKGARDLFRSAEDIKLGRDRFAKDFELFGYDAYRVPKVASL